MKLKLSSSNSHIPCSPLSNRKIIFSHKRALGDTIMFSAGVRDFKLLFPDISINVISNSFQVFDNNPYIDRSLLPSDKNVEFYQIGYPAIASANNTNVHFTQMFLLDMIAMADSHAKLPLSLGEFCSAFANGEVGDPCLGKKDKNPEAREPFIGLVKKYTDFCQKFSRQRGDIHLSSSEKSTNLIKDLYNYDHYWVIAPGGKRDCTAKIWDWRKFQKVIDYFDGFIKFVVIGKSDLLLEKLQNVIDLTDKFNDNLRSLFSLVFHSTGCVSGPSALMHIAAAIPPRLLHERKPCVSIFGGREPIGWSWYTNHQILHSNGIFSCCSNGGCWKARVIPLQKDPKHNKSLCKLSSDDDGQTIQKCMQTITSKDVIRAIEKYYEGNIYSLPSHHIDKLCYNIDTMNPDNPSKELIPVNQLVIKNQNSEVKKEESIVTENLTLNSTVVCENIHDSSSDVNLISDSLPRISSPLRGHTSGKRINLLGNLNSKGGGEQSLCMIASLLAKDGWDVTLFPFSSVHENYCSSGLKISKCNFSNMVEEMSPEEPLLFYANDSTNKFVDQAQPIVDKVSSLIIGINYVNKPLPTCQWLAKSGKVKAFIFQNEEKKTEFDREQIGFDHSQRLVLFGAIDLQKFLKVCPQQRDKDQPFVILKCCTPDWRKYVTIDSEGKGEKIHIWQKHLSKENDAKFYSRLLKEFREVRFEFMEAHKDLISEFKNESRMVFHKWDSMPVDELLARGHLFLYRTSNVWRDQYPRVVAEALAAGLPVLSEPRDGTKDRILHGDTGFYATHYDEFALHIKTFIRKENLRHAMGMNAKEWAKKNLDPRKWVSTINELLGAK